MLAVVATLTGPLTAVDEESPSVRSIVIEDMRGFSIEKGPPKRALSILNSGATLRLVAYFRVGASVPLDVTPVIGRRDKSEHHDCNAAPSQPLAPRLGYFVASKAEDDRCEKRDGKRIDYEIHACILVEAHGLLNGRHAGVLNQRTNSRQGGARHQTADRVDIALSKAVSSTLDGLRSPDGRVD
jgi:hypothetical protein